MLLDYLKEYVSEEEKVRKIAELIINGISNDDLLVMGYSNDIIERARVYALSVYF